MSRINPVPIDTRQIRVIRSPSDAAIGVVILSGFRCTRRDSITTIIIIMPRINDAIDAVAILDAHRIDEREKSN